MKTKIPHTLIFLGLFIVAAIAISFRNSALPAVSSAINKAKRTIVIDSGHGGADGGCVGINGAVEKDINLAIAKNLSEMLKISGFNVVMVRQEDTSLHDKDIKGLRNQKISDMKNRLKIISSYPDSLFISIHQNQYTDPKYFGAQIFYTTNNSTNEKLASLIQECFRELQPDNDREIKLIDNDLYLFKNTKQPAILAECGFLSNPNDAANLSNSDYQKKIAFTLYRGIIKYYGITDSDAERDENGETKDVLYMQ